MTDRHRPHYVSPKRDKRRPLVVYLEETDHAAMRAIAAREGRTLQDKGEELIRQCIIEATKPVPKNTTQPPTPSRPNSTPAEYHDEPYFPRRGPG